MTDMISGVNIIRTKASVTSINGAGWSGSCSELVSLGFRGQSPLRIFLGSKEHLDWLKIDLNVVKKVTVQDYKCAKN